MSKIIFFILFSSILVEAQFKIYKQIKDKQSQKPLELVNVIVKNTDHGTTSKEDGFFLLEGDFNLKDTVVFSRIGYKRISYILDDLIQQKIIFLESTVLMGQTVLVESSIAEKGKTPVTFSKISRESIKNEYLSQDIPEFLSFLPSTTFYSEGGSGVGYNYLNIRGFDQRRISISVNGIPQNDPEDHNVYWIDLPDLLASTELIQVQRGAGSGVVGFPAIGGSVNIITSSFSSEPKIDISSLYGSFNTKKYSVSLASGLVNDKYSVYAKLSQTLSTGFRENNWVNLKSYHLSAAKYGENITTIFNIYGGPIADGLTYTGLPKFAIKDKELRRKNYSYWEADDKSFTYFSERRPDEKENFNQPHFEIFNEIKLSKSIKFNNAVFLVIGEGFFDYDGSWADKYFFRLTEDNPRISLEDYDNINLNNVLIREQVENKQFGIIPRLQYEHENGILNLGGELRIHNSVHWGGIQYAQGLPIGLPSNYQYYYYEGGKDIFNFFINEQFEFNEKLSLQGELQSSYLIYKFGSEKYLNNEFEVSHFFLNPRIGVNYKFTGSLSGYFSLAKVSKEPRLINYYNAGISSYGETPQFNLNDNGSYNFNNPLVKPETMYSLDIGANYITDNLNLFGNIFYMNFINEIVSQGQVDRFGQPITGNANRTLHLGAEFGGELKMNELYSIITNVSFVSNTISSGNQFIGYTNNNEYLVENVSLDGNKIAGFPEIILNVINNISINDFKAIIYFKYVGEYYSDNFENKIKDIYTKYPGSLNYNDNKVDSYFTVDLLINYHIDFLPYLNNLKGFLKVNNLFNSYYASYAIGEQFFPAAERYFNFGIEVTL